MSQLENAEQRQLENAFPAEIAVSAVVQSDVKNVLVKPHSIRRTEMLNGFNQVKRLEQNKIVEAVGSQNV